MALSRGEIKSKQYGEGRINDNVDGLELLARKDKWYFMKDGKTDGLGSASEDDTKAGSEDGDGSEDESCVPESDEESLPPEGEDSEENGESEDEEDDSEKEEEDLTKDGGVAKCMDCREPLAGQKCPWPFWDCDHCGKYRQTADDTIYGCKTIQECSYGICGDCFKATPEERAARKGILKPAQPKPQKKRPMSRKERLEQMKEKRLRQTERARTVVTERVLGPEDFKKLKKLRMQRSVERQMGRKRKADEMWSSSSEDESGKAGSDSDDEGTGAGALPGSVYAEELASAPRKVRTKDGRMQSVKAGRGNWWEDKLEERRHRKGSLTNKEKKRFKPMMMGMNSRKVRRKGRLGIGETSRNLTKHIKTLKKKVGGKAKRRR